MRFASIGRVTWVLTLAACGDNIEAPILTIAGQPFPVVETVSFVYRRGPDQENLNPSANIAIYVAAQGGDLCAEVPNTIWHKNSRRLGFGVYDYNTNAFPSLIATYRVDQASPPTPYTANFLVYDSDANCRVTTVARAVSGTITVASLTNDIPNGTLDLMLDTGEHITAPLHSDQNCPSNVAPVPGPPTCL